MKLWSGLALPTVLSQGPWHWTREGRRNLATPIRIPWKSYGWIQNADIQAAILYSASVAYSCVLRTVLRNCFRGMIIWVLDDGIFRDITFWLSQVELQQNALSYSREDSRLKNRGWSSGWITNGDSARYSMSRFISQKCAFPGPSKLHYVTKIGAHSAYSVTLTKLSIESKLPISRHLSQIALLYSTVPLIVLVSIFSIHAPFCRHHPGVYILCILCALYKNAGMGKRLAT